MPIIPDSNSCGAGDEAERLYGQLVNEDDFELPDIDLSGSDFDFPKAEDNPLYDAVPPITIDELTTKTVNGDGVFDAIMTALSAHLEKEFAAQRISGREYSEVYTGALNAAMNQAVSFLMGKDSAHWQGVVAQAQARRAEIDAVTARVELENTKLQHFMLKANAKTAAADYGIKKIQLSLADIDYCIKLLEKAALTVDVDSKLFNHEHILPLQRDQLREQISQIQAVITGIGWDNRVKQADVEDMLPKRIEMLNSQMLTADIEREQARYQMDHVLPWQSKLTQEQAETARAQTTGNRSDGSPVAGSIGWDNRIKEFNLNQMMPTQAQMVQEQLEQVRAQTLDTRTDGAPVTGVLGKQKELYDQQIESYQRDAEVKAAKMFIDTWVTQKTIDEGLLAPDSLQNASVNTIMNRIKTNNGLNI